MLISYPATDSRRMSVRFVGMLLALMCGLAAATSRAELLYVSMGKEFEGTPSIRTYDISLGSSGAVAGSEQTFVSGTANLNVPFGMTFDSSENLYVVNSAPSGQPSVSIFNSAGTYQGGFGSQTTLFIPAFVQIDSSNRVWVSNSQNNSISMFINGTAEPGITSNVSGPTGMALTSASDFLYVANRDANSISKFDVPAGTLAQTISGNLTTPYGLAFDQAGNLYAANSGATTVSKFDSSGTFVSTIGSASNLSTPIAVAFDSTGNMYVSNFGNKTISKFDSAGTFQFSWSTPLTPQGLAIAPVPEPATLALAAIAGVAGLASARRRRRTHQA